MQTSDSRSVEADNPQIGDDIAARDPEFAPCDIGRNSNIWLRSCLVIGVASLLAPVAIRIFLRLHTRSQHDVWFGTSPQEVSDKAVWISVLGCTAVILLLLLSQRYRSKFSQSSPSLRAIAVVIALLVVGIGWIQTLPPYGGVYWFGFGYGPLLVSLISVPLLWRMKQGLSRTVLTYFAVVVDVVIIAAYLPSALQPLWAIIDPSDAGYIFNEIAAPVAGNYPIATTTPQYTGIFGYPILMLAKVMPHSFFSSNLGLITSVYLTLLTLATLAILVAITVRVLPSKSRPLAGLFAIPLVLVHQSPASAPTGSITMLFSAIPVRTLPMVVLGGLLVSSRVGRSWARAILLGAFAGLAALNNFEFGMPALIAAFATTVASSAAFALRPALRITAQFSGSVATVFLLYIALVRLNGSVVHLANWTAFARAFASGFGNLPMPVLGTHIPVLMILGSGATLGAYVLRSSASPTAVGREAPRRVVASPAAICALYFGLAGLGSFGYYVGRSVTSGQLQIFLIYLAPIVASLFALVQLPEVTSEISARTGAAIVATLLPVGLIFGSLLQAPDPAQQWQRVLGEDVGPHWTSVYEQQVATVRGLVSYAHTKLGSEPIDLAVVYGNYVAIRLSLRSVSTVDVPTDAAIIGDPVLGAFCRRLSEVSRDVLIQGFYANSPEGMCPGFKRRLELGNGFEIVQPSTR